jgi:hypothetical protein
VSTTLIKGKVASVINIRDIALNIGEAQGVKEGMVFAVLSPKGERIVDPDTRETIGSFPIEKVRVKVYRVGERASLARTFKVQKRPLVRPSYPDFSSIFDPRLPSEAPQTLKVEDRPYLEEIDEAESYVKVGDPVVQVVESESADS